MHSANGAAQKISSNENIIGKKIFTAYDFL